MSESSADCPYCKQESSDYDIDRACCRARFRWDCRHGRFQAAKRVLCEMRPSGYILQVTEESDE